jgi:hypothetical protein
MKTKPSTEALIANLDAIPKDRPFTPVMPDGVRLVGVTRGDFTVLEGSLADSGRGHYATILLGAITYKVIGKPCGARCHCDARLEVVTE